MSYFWQILVPTVENRLAELLQAPFINPEMIWIITPLMVTLVLMTFYFGKYAKEELGWNTAVGNSIVLLFIAIDLLRYVFNLTTPGSILNYQLHPISTIICAIVGVEALTLMFTSFFKALPKQVTFFICAPLPVNLQAYIAVATVYTNVRLDWYTLVAVIALFIVLYIFIKILQLMERGSIQLLRKEQIAEIEQEKKLAKEQIKEAEKAKKKLIAEEKEEKGKKKKK